MERPNHIPQDALDSARHAYGTIEAFGWNVSWYSQNPIPDDAWPIDIIARSILAERERCAKIARHVSRNFTEDPGDDAIERAKRSAQAVTAEHIATAIDGGSPALHAAIRAGGKP